MIEVLFIIVILVAAFRSKGKPSKDTGRYPGPPWVSNNRKNR